MIQQWTNKHQHEYDVYTYIIYNMYIYIYLKYKVMKHIIFRFPRFFWVKRHVSKKAKSRGEICTFLWAGGCGASGGGDVWSADNGWLQIKWRYGYFQKIGVGNYPPNHPF